MDDFKNCSRVRELVLANQEVFLKATHVGRTGNALATVDEDWLPIIRYNGRKLSKTNFLLTHSLANSLTHSLTH